MMHFIVLPRAICYVIIFLFLVPIFAGQPYHQAEERDPYARERQNKFFGRKNEAHETGNKDKPIFNERSAGVNITTVVLIFGSALLAVILIIGLLYFLIHHFKKNKRAKDDNQFRFGWEQQQQAGNESVQQAAEDAMKQGAEPASPTHSVQSLNDSMKSQPNSIDSSAPALPDSSKSPIPSAPSHKPSTKNSQDLSAVASQKSQTPTIESVRTQSTSLLLPPATNFTMTKPTTKETPHNSGSVPAK